MDRIGAKEGRGDSKTWATILDASTQLVFAKLQNNFNHFDTTF